VYGQKEQLVLGLFYSIFWFAVKARLGKKLPSFHLIYLSGLICTKLSVPRQL